MQILRHSVAAIQHAGEGRDHTTDVVPLSDRRGPATLGLLWVTMVTGFPTVLVGFEWYKSGLTLPQVIQGVLISCALLLTYGIPATLLGAKSGQTYSLLSRGIFGRWGSRLISFNLVWINLGWYGLNANWLAEGLKGIYHLDVPTMGLAVALAILMAFNNYFGFSGIANFARYLAAPMLIAWVGFTFFKASVACPSSVWTAAPQHAFPQALTLVSTFVIGYGVWGNEADYWRYGKPKAILSAIPLIAAIAIGQILFPVTGWMMAHLTGVTEVGAATNLMNQYAFGGVSILAAAVLTICYFAVNDSGLYGAINGIENLKSLPRQRVVVGLTIGCAISAALLANCARAFEVVSTLSSIFLPAATVIMIAEFFWLNNRSSRPIDFSRVPDFSELPALRWPAVVALFAGCAVGLITCGLIPGLESMHVGIFSLQSWLTCIGVYICLRMTERPVALSERKAALEKLLPALDLEELATNSMHESRTSLHS